MRTGILLRTPAAEVYALLTDPELTTKIWFTHSTGPLEPGATVTWTWEMFDAQATVVVKDLQPDRRIVVDWGDEGAMTEVEWVLEDRGDGTTHVDVTETGFTGTDDEQVRKALDSTIGFTKVLCAAKAYLEHDVLLEVVADQ